MMRMITTALIALVMAASYGHAQAPVKNPRALTFTCADHVKDTGHEVDIVDAKGVVIHTLQGGDPAADAAGDVTIPINVQPIAFGSYTFVARALFGAIASGNSLSSEVWQRVPIAPGKPKVGEQIIVIGRPPILPPPGAGGDIVNAASCSRADVNTAMGLVGAGDTLQLPSCGATSWTSGIEWTVPANVTMLGAGSLSTLGGGDATIITDNYVSGTPLMNFIVSAGSFRFAGITVQGGASGSLKESGTLVFNGTTTALRIDHNHIDMRGYTGGAVHSKPIRFIGPINGVLDNSIIDLSGLGWLHFQGDGIGDGPYAAVSGFGTSNSIFIESNTFNSTYYASQITDCNAGGRFVIRYNTVVGAGVGQTHPTGGSGRGRGCRAHELYGNAVTPRPGFDPKVDEPNFTFSWMSSGVSMVWGNTADGVYKNFLYLSAMRKNNATYTQGATPAGWGYCGTIFNGTGSNWDGNTPANTGYPCIDQPGRGIGQLLVGDFPNALNNVTGTIAWPNQALEPVYEWGNTASVVAGWGGNYIGNDSGNHIAVNREYYAYTASFTGATGVGTGVRSSRPSTCTTGVAYWSTDQGGNWNTASGGANDGTLDLCTATNTWTNASYTPYWFPHLLRGA